MSRTDYNQPALVLKKPRITEKATFMTGNKYPVYTFEIPDLVNKLAVKKAVKLKYNIDPIKVNIIKLPRKKVTVRRTNGMRAGIKKALVYMPVGTNIDFI